MNEKILRLEQKLTQIREQYFQSNCKDCFLQLQQLKLEHQRLSAELKKMKHLAEHENRSVSRNYLFAQREAVLTGMYLMV